jgi:hypothetical protein
MPRLRRFGWVCVVYRCYTKELSHKYFHPQIAPIHTDGAPEKIWKICVICGFVFQASTGGTGSAWMMRSS